MKKTARVPILDLNQAAFLFMHGNIPELELNGTRVTFCFAPDNAFFSLSARYNCNESVPCLDLVNAQRQLRSMMMAAKGGPK